GRELSKFEASLPDKAAAEAEKADARKLGELLKRELSARTLTNEEFFSHQLREKIGRLREAPARQARETRSTWWTIPRLLWTGALSLAVFLFFMVLVMREKNSAEETKCLTLILNAHVV